MKDEVIEGGHIVLGTVLGFQLPRSIILCVFPAPVKFVDFALRLRLNLSQATSQQVSVESTFELAVFCSSQPID